MLIEILVLRSDERIDHELRNGLDGEIKASLPGIFRQQRTIRRMDARHDRRFVVLKLGIVGQILREMPQQASRRGDADDEEKGPDRKEEAEKAEKEFHRGTQPISAALG